MTKLPNGDDDVTLAALNSLFTDGRPTLARISGISMYSPFTSLRGSAESQTTIKDRLRIERLLSSAIDENGDGRSHRAMAVFLLAEGKLEQARSEMDTAFEKDPRSAAIASDAGALFYEIAKSRDHHTDGANYLYFLNGSLKQLDLAIELDASLLEAKFNRALCLEALFLRHQARVAWSDYLEIDLYSPWADEARDRLSKLDDRIGIEMPAEELEAKVVAASDIRDSEEVWQMLSQNRELIRDKYLPHRLSFSSLTVTGDRKRQLLTTLSNVGEIERQRTGDRFAQDIANFYARSPNLNSEQLLAAHKLNREGTALCLSQNYSDAIPKFDEARRLFESSGSRNEARLSQYFAAYARLNAKDSVTAERELESILVYANANSYKWLAATAGYWIGNIRYSRREPSRSIEAYLLAAENARAVSDSYSLQRNLSALATVHSKSGQFSSALDIVPSVLEMNGTSVSSLRQQYRSFSEMTFIMNASSLHSASRAVNFEALKFAELSNDLFFQSQAKAFAGRSSHMVGDSNLADNLFEQSRADARQIGGATEQRLTAFIDMHQGGVELDKRNYVASAEMFKRAAEYYTNVELYFYTEDARRGLMLSYLGTGDLAELAVQIPTNIKLAEEFRSRSTTFEQRESYLNSKRNVYDIASEFEYVSGNLAASYNYKELASSRALLERMRLGEVAVKELRSPNQTAPLGLDEIRNALPVSVQLVQYALYDKRLVIWLISREKVVTREVGVESRDLEAIIAKLLKKVSNPTATTDETWREPSRSLYDTLITPIFGELDETRSIVIVPDKAIFNVPFALLTNEAGELLLSNFETVYSPSANVFIESTRAAEKRTTAANETLLAIGDPAFDRAKYPKLNSLPEAVGEVSTISREYTKKSVLTGETATSRAFLENLPRSDVVHFAGHYVAVPESPLSSFLLFASEREIGKNDSVTNKELSSILLNETRLIVFAACNTGLESYAASEGMEGLSRTFLGAKVPLVVASRWPVDSAATSKLMIAFHRNRTTQKMTSVKALQQAQIQMFQDPSNPEKHPFYWAAFSVFGGYAEF